MLKEYAQLLDVLKINNHELKYVHSGIKINKRTTHLTVKTVNIK